MSYRKGVLLIVLFVTMELACSRGPFDIPANTDDIPIDEECPPGTHEYFVEEFGTKWSQKTCKEPEYRVLGGDGAVFRCDCDEPTVLDETTNKCVNLVDCYPKKKSNKIR